jgi:hypothetical protein
MYVKIIHRFLKTFSPTVTVVAADNFLLKISSASFIWGYGDFFKIRSEVKNQVHCSYNLLCKKASSLHVPCHPGLGCHFLAGIPIQTGFHHIFLQPQVLEHIGFAETPISDLRQLRHDIRRPKVQSVALMHLAIAPLSNPVATSVAFILFSVPNT